MKYLNTEITFAEIPDEITGCINITGCPNHCPGCHSPFLWEDTGQILTNDFIKEFVNNTKEGISCICFMGGDQNPEEINGFASFVKKTYPNLKVAWYSGKTEIPESIRFCNFDYIKIGPYIKEKGGLNKITTNQMLLRVDHINGGGALTNITYKFWK